jgi:hypothetical protein
MSKETEKNEVNEDLRYAILKAIINLQESIIKDQKLQIKKVSNISLFLGILIGSIITLIIQSL